MASRLFQSFLLHQGCSEYPSTRHYTQTPICPEPKCLEVASFLWWQIRPPCAPWKLWCSLAGCPHSSPDSALPNFLNFITNRWKIMSHCSLRVHCSYEWGWTAFHMLNSTLHFLFCSSRPHPLSIELEKVPVFFLEKLDFEATQKISLQTDCSPPFQLDVRLPGITRGQGVWALRVAVLGLGRASTSKFPQGPLCGCCLNSAERSILYLIMIGSLAFWGFLFVCLTLLWHWFWHSPSGL